MANNINTNYSMYQKPLNHIGGKRDAGRKKGVEKEDKEKKPFGEDFGVQLSDAGLAALELQRKQKAKDEEGGETSRDLVVLSHHLDTNQHMNNAQYVHFAVMYLPAEAEIRELRVEYKKQAMLGDHIKPVIYHTADDVVLVSMNGEDGKPYAVVEMTLLKEGKL